MKKVTTLLVLALAAASPALAQWNTAATPTCIFSTTYTDEGGKTLTGGDYYACSPKVARTADKKTWIAWKTWENKVVNGIKAPAVRTFLQLLDRDGNPQFEEPVLVNDHITPSYWSEYALLAAPDGSAIVTVADSRTEDDTYADAEVTPQTFTPAIYKVDQEGNFLWGLDGVEYRDIKNGPFTNAFLVGDDTYFIFMNSSEDGTKGKTYIQRIDADGVEAWEEPRVLRDEMFLQYKILPSLDGNFLLFDHTPDGARVQCLNRDLEDQWGEAVIYDDHYYGGYEMNHYKVVSDGAGGACVAFQRFMGTTSHNIRVQHINADGSLGFGLTGLDAYNADEYDHAYPSIAANPETQEILVQFASDLDRSGNVMHQKFTFDGDYLYNERAVSIASKSANTNAYFYGLIGVGALKGGDWIAVYRDIAGYDNESIVIRRYDKEGKRTWTRTIGRNIAPSDLRLVVEEEATYLFWREMQEDKNPGINIFRIGNDGTYNVTYPEAGPQAKEGDVNGDAVVDVADIATVIDVMASSGSDEAADVNHDGTVDVADIATIITIMAGE